MFDIQVYMYMYKVGRIPFWEHFKIRIFQQESAFIRLKTSTVENVVTDQEYLALIDNIRLNNGSCLHSNSSKIYIITTFTFIILYCNIYHYKKYGWL